MTDYRTSLIGTESGGNWAAKNNETGAGGKKGHFGRVQFGFARLQDAMNAGAIPQGTTPDQFMASPDLQVAAENWHFGDLESRLGDLVGKTVNGKVMDMAALVAMGHLGGAGGARKYVESGGKYNPSDSFGTSLSDYAGTHGGKARPTGMEAEGPGRTDRNPARLAWAYANGKMTAEDAALYEKGMAEGRFPTAKPPEETQPDPLAVYAATAMRPRQPFAPVALGGAPIQNPTPWKRT